MLNQAVMNKQNEQRIEAQFPLGDKAPAEYFTGTAWIKMLVADDRIFHHAIGNVIFEPGARNNWHSHPGGQILLITGGMGYYQEEGKPIQLLRKGDLVEILPDVVHWHGATPDRRLTHIAITTNTQYGIVNWLDSVSDEEYNSFQQLDFSVEIHNETLQTLQ